MRGTYASKKNKKKQRNDAKIVTYVRIKYGKI